MGTKERREKKEGREDRRGRSRDRRRSEKKTSRSRDRRRKGEDSRSSGGKPVLTAATAAVEQVVDDEVECPTGRSTKTAEAAEETEEQSEEEVSTDDPESKPAPAGKPAEAEPKVDRQGGQPAHSGAKVPEPDELAPKGSKLDSSAQKYGSFQCSICGRSVGGGEQGSFSHRRSPFHLACWVYYNATEKRSWQDCVKDGHNWSQLLWQKGTTGPPEGNDTGPPEGKESQWTAKKRQKTPPPVRAELKKDRHSRDPDEPDDSSTGTGGAASSSKSLLLQMWETTLKELR